MEVSGPARAKGEGEREAHAARMDWEGEPVRERRPWAGAALGGREGAEGAEEVGANAGAGAAAAARARARGMRKRG